MQSKRQEDKPEQRMPTMANGISTKTRNRKEVFRETEPGKKIKAGSPILSKLVDKHRASNKDNERG